VYGFTDVKNVSFSEPLKMTRSGVHKFNLEVQHGSVLICLLRLRVAIKGIEPRGLADSSRWSQRSVDHRMMGKKIGTLKVQETGRLASLFHVVLDSVISKYFL
jgi:hypothetical protein